VVPVLLTPKALARSSHGRPDSTVLKRSLGADRVGSRKTTKSARFVVDDTRGITGRHRGASNEVYEDEDCVSPDAF
jgi:hypothetical protein